MLALHRKLSFWLELMVVLFKEGDHENVWLILNIYGSHLKKNASFIAIVVMPKIAGLVGF